MSNDDKIDLHQEQGVIALGEQLPQASSANSSAFEHEAFKNWLLTVLYEHRVQISAEFKMHIDSLHTRLGECDACVDRACGTPYFPCDSCQPPETLPSQGTRPCRNDEYGLIVSRSSEIGDTEETFQGKLTAVLEKEEAANPVVSQISLLTSVIGRVVKSVTKPRGENYGSESSELAEQFLTSELHASSILDYIVGFLVLANSGVMICQMEYYGFLSRIALGDIGDDGSWKDADLWFLLFEHIFNAFFLIELIIRLFIHRLAFFRQRSLIFDAVLVMISSMQLYFLGFNRNSGSEQILVFRILRFTRCVRVLRLIRVLKLFTSLRVLVRTIFSSFGALMWSMVLLLVIIANAGLVMSVLLRDFIISSQEDLSTRRWTFRYYGTATRAIYTLFEVTLAGCWPQYFRPLIERVSVWWVVFVVIYISVVVFAIIRLISALFLKETLQIASEDAEMMVKEKLKLKNAYIKKLECVFKAVDTSGTGKVSAEEFQCILSNQVVKTWLQLLEVEVHDADALFNLLHDGAGELTYDEFMKGLMRLKGQARTMDVVGLMHSMDKVHHHLADVQAQLNRMHVHRRGKEVEKDRTLEH